MALLLSNLYHALIEAGVDSERAEAAAAEAAAVGLHDLADVRTDLAGVKTDIAVLQAQMEHLHHRFTHLTWGIGIGVSLILAFLLLELNWLWQIMQKVTKLP